ncbi:hypothetical protein [Brachybacterium sp. GPGPB12]|uniref:hypothetical protein n=1 Tax=Brachybacterium sp. GPGPB12 TaxID=3023517 RepID=UPI0031344C37
MDVSRSQFQLIEAIEADDVELAVAVLTLHLRRFAAIARTPRSRALEDMGRGALMGASRSVLSSGRVHEDFDQVRFAFDAIFARGPGIQRPTGRLSRGRARRRPRRRSAPRARGPHGRLLGLQGSRRARRRGRSWREGSSTSTRR